MPCLDDHAPAVRKVMTPFYVIDTDVKAQTADALGDDSSADRNEADR